MIGRVKAPMLVAAPDDRGLAGKTYSFCELVILHIRDFTLVCKSPKCWNFLQTLLL
jgi:hypothetical protein